MREVSAPPEIAISPEPFDGPVVQGLLAELPWGVGDLTAAEFTPPDGTMLVARLPGGGPVGCCGVRRLTEEVGEIKRLFVLGAGRRRGVARALLAATEEVARTLGYRELWLDTHADEPAALFASAGWRPIPAYNDHDYARHWFARCLIAGDQPR
jgi:GNAT superfamily N-acetyltransferase